MTTTAGCDLRAMNLSDDLYGERPKMTAASEDPTDASVIGDTSNDPTLGREVGDSWFEDPSHGRKVIERPREDPTEGQEVGEGRNEDPTQGHELGALPNEDPTSAERKLT